LKLYVVRHPRPSVPAGYCYGATDVPVDDQELDAAHAALAAAGLPGRLPVYSSPLQRCAALAHRVQPAMLRLDARLAEMDFGSWEMRPWSEVARAQVDAWAADLLRYRPGGGESVLDVARRVAAFVDDLRASPDAEALAICHAGTIRLLMSLQAGVPLDQAALAAASAPHRISFNQVKALNF
jgi:alpha-ribazole phosphatase